MEKLFPRLVYEWTNSISEQNPLPVGWLSIVLVMETLHEREWEIGALSRWDMLVTENENLKRSRKIDLTNYLSSSYRNTPDAGM